MRTDRLSTTVITLRLALPLALALGLQGCTDAVANDTAVQRGDIAFAAGETDEALAEYRLAARQENAPAEILARVAHAYVSTGQVDEAHEFYLQAIEADSSWTLQAVADLMGMAESAQRDGDRFRMASAVEAARTIQPSVGLDGLALPLARHHFGNGEYGKALPLFQRALEAGGDTLPAVMFEIGQAHEQIGDCSKALVFFESYRANAPTGRRSEVDWFIGTCSFEVARGLRGIEGGADRGSLLEALQNVDRAIEMGEPRNLLGRAWFERGEILADLGECEDAIASFRQVEITEGPSGGALVTRARERLDDIRFGRGLRELRVKDPCG